MTQSEQVAGLILAGGLSRRMGGGDKALMSLGGQSMIERVIERARPQVGPLLVNANGDPAEYARFGLPVEADSVPGHAGPLAGILTGMDWVRREHPECRWLASFATDTPLFPTDLVARLLAAVTEQGADMACATSLGRAHPVFALWPVRLAEELRRAMLDEDMRKIDAWTAHYKVVQVDWAGDRVDPFYNANTPEDLAYLEAVLAAPEAAAPLHDRVALGLIVQRRDGVTKWQEDVWRPVEVVLNAPAIPGATLLRRSEGCDYYLFGELGLELHRSDLASYRYNLASGQPRLWIGLRPGAGEGGKPAVVLVSAAPDEAQAFLDSGEDVVETIAMPADLRAWVESFVLRHPPPPPMRKRKRVNYDPDKAGFGRGAGEEGR